MFVEIYIKTLPPTVCYTDAYTEEKKEEEEGEKNADQIEDEEEPAPPVPETRLLNFNANNLPNVEDVTALKRLYLKVRCKCREPRFFAMRREIAEKTFQCPLLLK